MGGRARLALRTRASLSFPLGGDPLGACARASRPCTHASTRDCLARPGHNNAIVSISLALGLWLASSPASPPLQLLSFFLFLFFYFF
ncbi:hypothetical protein psal_cds_418 [Pandoravirus salinus]|uniref:Uncharacterized protein n=1 Tax=Pandoravirus salinus TaxID=1349410 RepID=S4W1W0_9VIRU|nr:hypothetical protein psal_cds_418 [Pandoravirus salinus]AGO84140.1 hypothetical protein psal_cds_418 [Pandoravirus salinus]